jgi:cold shock CspA family protein
VQTSFRLAIGPDQFNVVLKADPVPPQEDRRMIGKVFDLAPDGYGFIRTMDEIWPFHISTVVPGLTVFNGAKVDFDVVDGQVAAVRGWRITSGTKR